MFNHKNPIQMASNILSENIENRGRFLIPQSSLQELNASLEQNPELFLNNKNREFLSQWPELIWTKAYDSNDWKLQYALEYPKQNLKQVTWHTKLKPLVYVFWSPGADIHGKPLSDYGFLKEHFVPQNSQVKVPHTVVYNGYNEKVVTWKRWREKLLMDIKKREAISSKKTTEIPRKTTTSTRNSMIDTQISIEQDNGIIIDMRRNYRQMDAMMINRGSQLTNNSFVEEKIIDEINYLKNLCFNCSKTENLFSNKSELTNYKNRINQFNKVIMVIDNHIVELEFNQTKIGNNLFIYGLYLKKKSAGKTPEKLKLITWNEETHTIEDCEYNYPKIKNKITGQETTQLNYANRVTESPQPQPINPESDNYEHLLDFLSDPSFSEVNENPVINNFNIGQVNLVPQIQPTKKRKYNQPPADNNAQPIINLPMNPNASTQYPSSFSRPSSFANNINIVFNNRVSGSTSISNTTAPDSQIITQRQILPPWNNNNPK